MLNKGEFIDTGELFHNSGFYILAWTIGTGSNSLWHGCMNLENNDDLE